MTVGHWVPFLLTCVGGQTDPLGGTTAFKLVEPSGGGGLTFEHYYEFGPQPPVRGEVTVSIWAKPNGRNWLWLELTDTVNPLYINYDLQNGVLGTVVGNGISGASVHGSITSQGAGWYTCSLTISGYTLNPIHLVAFGPEPSNEGYGYSGNGVSGTFLWNIQFSGIGTQIATETGWTGLT